MSDDRQGFRSTFERQGYAFPLAAMSPGEAAGSRGQLEAVEAAETGRPELSQAIFGAPHLLLPFIDEIMRLPAVLDPVEQLLGPDLLVWGTSLFIKEPGTEDYISWHQDLKYWGLDSDREISAWVALSTVDEDNGAMRFIPGSHLNPILPHDDTFDAANILTRGQSLAVEVDEAEAVSVVLEAGQMSLHHGHLFHASGPNRSARRRIGLSIQLITPDMRQVVGGRDYATLVRGEDRYGHFELLGPPRGLFRPDDLARARRFIDAQTDHLYDGTERVGRQFQEMGLYAGPG